MATRKPRKAQGEWVGGVILARAYVTGEGEPYRPDTVFWMEPSGSILGMTVRPPGAPLAEVARHFLETTRAPMIGVPRVPARVRVASAELADALAAAVGEGVEVVCAPTPELDALGSALADRLGEAADEEQTYLGPGITAEDVLRFFGAAARLYRARPWHVVPSDAALVSVTIPRFGIDRAVLSVVGQLGTSFGVLLFRSLEDFREMEALGEALARGVRPSRVPAHQALNYEPKAEMSASLRAEIARYRWPLAGPKAMPWLVAIDADVVARPPTRDELIAFEVLAEALATFVSDARVGDAWSGAPFEWKGMVETGAGPIEVTLAAPYPGDRRGARPAPARRGRAPDVELEQLFEEMATASGLFPFRDVFPERAGELRDLRARGATRGVPAGDYLFDEWYCTDPRCDCRRVMIRVHSARDKRVVASIGYGFEPAKPPFDDEPQIMLDPLNPQGPDAEDFLALFEEMIDDEPEYRQRLHEHYAAFKEAVNDARHPRHAMLRSRGHDDPSFRPAYPAASGKVGANDACPCGSGKKYKKCCRA